MKLKELRKKFNKKQEEIAKYLNISTTGYNYYETDKREPSIETLIKLADYYNVSLDYLVGRENNPNILTSLYNEKKELIKISEELNEKNFNKLFIYATALLDGQNA